MSTTRLIPAETLTRARAMRHEAAPIEAKLWWFLRNRRLGGYKFRRQHPIAPFVADFFCAELSLVIELDGTSHLSTTEYDEQRTKRLERDGCHVMRFLNVDVALYLDAVLEEILRECKQLAARNHPHPSPLPEYRERGR
ncbi:MAG TPA: endonuclease domain-containing protein [Tepidisphaeraceae bacterium]|jgi:very-short-patch-repair endonuclease|nr:endonuclease domain-containing protein [Tepidisphaeraceae bacterium]